jgi:hypothetical protein
LTLDITTPDYSLIGFDTYLGDYSVVLPGPRYCANPIITPDGNSVIFSDLEKKEVNIVSWCGTGARLLVPGYGLCVQRDTSKGIDWVYVSDSAYGSRVNRYNLAKVNQWDSVYSRTKVSIRFTVSADGRFAGGEFPWPIVGEVSLSNSEFKQFGSGCNAAIAPDNSYRLFHMDGDHKSIWMYDSNAKVINQIHLNTVPGIENNASWIPRWSSDARFMTLTAPCQPNPKTQTEDIFFGCFNEVHDSITRWIRVTDTPDSFENYAYAWIGKEMYVKLDRYKLHFFCKGSIVNAEHRTITVSSTSNSLQECTITPMDDWLIVKHSVSSGKIIIENRIDSTRVMEPGFYSTVATIKCPGYADEPYRVDLKVDDNDAVPTSLSITPNNQQLRQFDSLQFSKTCLDQFKSPVFVNCGWSVSGGGAINDAGLFRSNGDTGSFFVKSWVLTSPTIGDSTKITIYENPRITSPDSNVSINVGDSLVVKWNSHMTKFKDLMVYLSLNGGRSWKLLNPKRAIYPQFESTGSFTWYIPQSFCDGDTSNDPKRWTNCIVKITDYLDEIRTVTEKPFTIMCSGQNNSIYKHNPPADRLLSGVLPDENVTISVFTISGRLVYRSNEKNDNVDINQFPRGIYYLRAFSPHQTLSRKFVVSY